MEEGDLFSTLSHYFENDKKSPPRKITPVPYNPSLTILLEVFLFLERKTIESNQMVCRYWNDIIIRNNSILPIYLFGSLHFTTYKKEQISVIYMNLPNKTNFFLKKSK